MGHGKALESLGVDWGKTLPIPNFDASTFPEVKALYNQGIGDMQRTFRGIWPFNDGMTVRTAEHPEQGFPVPQPPERPEEFTPGLTPELMATKGTAFCGSGANLPDASRAAQQPATTGATTKADILGTVRKGGKAIPLKGADQIEVSDADEPATNSPSNKM